MLFFLSRSRKLNPGSSAVISRIVLDPFESPYRSEAATPGEKPPDRPSISAAAAVSSLPLKAAVRKLEIQMLNKALESARYNQKKAAEMLGLSYDQFRGLKRKYNDQL